MVHPENVGGKKNTDENYLKNMQKKCSYVLRVKLAQINKKQRL